MRTGFMVLTICAATVLACGGPTEEEWRGAQQELTKLKGDVDAANKRHTEDEQKYEDAEQQIAQLKEALTQLGTALKKDPIGQLEGLGFTDQQIANLLLRRDKDAQDPPPAPPPPSPPTDPSGWHVMFRGTYVGSGACAVEVAVNDGAAGFASQGSLRTAFVRYLYSNHKDCPKEKAKLTLMNQRFDCNRRTQEILAATSTDWNGKRSDDAFPGDGSLASTVFPDNSFGDRTWRYVCGAP